MRNVLLFGLAVFVLTCTATAQAASYWTATDNFDSYAPGSYLNTQGGWTDTGGNNYQIVAAPGGVAGTQAVNQGGGSNQMNWTSHPWNWLTDLAVGDMVVAKMDFQANGGGAFDDDRVGWVEAANQGSSSYHFAIQLDNADGGLVYYRRDQGGGSSRGILIPTASLGATGSNWYREELNVTKLTDALGPNGARLDAYFSPLDGAGNPISTLTATMMLDTSTWRGFDEQVYPMYKNYSATPGNADNAYFALVQVPEPSTLVLLLVAGGLGWAATAYRRRK